eukprot:gene22750-28908_t
MRIYDTCHPEKPPSEFKVATSVTDGITKLCWSTTEDNIVLIGKKSGTVEKWDTRSNTVLAPVQKAAVSGGETVIDFEVNTTHGVIMVASGKKVCSYASSDLTLLKEFDMPSPLTFKEEGGVSLCPDGKKFIAFDYSTGEVLRTFKGHHGPIRCVRYHPGGLVGASGSEDATIRLWDLGVNSVGSAV